MTSRGSHLFLFTFTFTLTSACADKPASVPSGNQPDPIIIPSQPASSSSAGSSSTPSSSSSTPAESDDERTRIREQFDKLAEERDRLDKQIANGGGASSEPADAKDPTGGTFSLNDALAGLPNANPSKPLMASIKTSQGTLKCRLFDDRAPNTVANFIGLARGTRPWKSAADGGRWVKKPAYDGTTFHRVIKGFMIQGGDPLGTGAGEPGYVIKDEIWAGAKHDRPGLLCMANRGHDTNGAQFFITDAKAVHLDNNYTIFGECSPVAVVHAIANVQVSGERPVPSVTIDRIEIQR